MGLGVKTYCLPHKHCLLSPPYLSLSITKLDSLSDSALLSASLCSVSHLSFLCSLMFECLLFIDHGLELLFAGRQRMGRATKHEVTPQALTLPSHPTPQTTSHTVTHAGSYEYVHTKLPVSDVSIIILVTEAHTHKLESWTGTKLVTSPL